MSKTTDKSHWYNGYAGPTPDSIRDLVIDQIENGVVWDWRFSLVRYDYQDQPMHTVYTWKLSDTDYAPHAVEAAYLDAIQKRYEHPTAVEIEPLGDTPHELIPPARYWCHRDYKELREECEYRRRMLWTHLPGSDDPKPNRFAVRGLFHAGKWTIRSAAQFLSMTERNIKRWTTGELQISWHCYRFLRIMAEIDPEYRRIESERQQEPAGARPEIKHRPRW